MDEAYRRFERIARNAFQYTDSDFASLTTEHPFINRNIHDLLVPVCGDLFDNGHYSQATFEAFKYVDKIIQRLANSAKSGTGNVMSLFSGLNPELVICNEPSQTCKDLQEGYKFLFAGSMLAIRNPRAHEVLVRDSPEACLDYLVLASVLIRRLELSGYGIPDIPENIGGLHPGLAIEKLDE